MNASNPHSDLPATGKVAIDLVNTPPLGKGPLEAQELPFGVYRGKGPPAPAQSTSSNPES